MKKMLVILLAMLMLLTLVACGSKKTDDPVEADNAEASEKQDETEEIPEDAFVIPLLTLDYDDSVWTMDEENISDDEDYCWVNLQIPDPEDPEYYLIDVEISASVEDPYDFRSDIVYYGFDQYEYAENKSYDLVNVGGVDCLRYEEEGYEYSIVYLGRDESAGVTVCVDISTSDAGDSRIADLIKGLKFTLTDTGNEDGPWEWEGEAFSAEDASVAAGSFTVETKWIPINEYISTFETFDHAVAAVEDTVYILADGVLKEYAYDGEDLDFKKDIELPEDGYNILQSTDDGSVWVCGGLNDVIKLKDGETVASFSDLDNVALSSDGSWGLSYFSSNECKKVTFDGAKASTEDMVFAEVDLISYAFVDNDFIYVCANAVDESGHKVFVYNTDGVLQKTLCDAEGEGLGCITYIAKTANGFIGFDGNMRSVLLWDNDGTVIAELEDTELFGTSYPWFCASDMLSDGSIITVMTDERADMSATELVAFIVKGF